MTNTMTDELRLVQMEVAKSVFGLFGRMISFEDGFSLEVFRDGMHLGSVRSKDVAITNDIQTSFERMSIRDGDILLRVNLGSRILTIKGDLLTQDGYTQGYEIVLEIMVNDPTQFAMHYVQQNDPIYIAKTALEGELNNYAILRSSNELAADALLYRATNALSSGSNRLIGVEVVRVHKVQLQSNLKLLQELEILKQEHLSYEQIRRLDEQINQEQARQQEYLSESHRTIEIFFSYAREDEALRKELEKHLRVLKRQGIIDIWHDRDISAGMEWELEIDRHLNTAQIILLLISPDFMDSDYCYGIEMKRAMERHVRGQARVIPVILRPIYWQGAPFGKLLALPTDAKPVRSQSWYDLDDAFFNVAEGIRKAVEELITKL
jgi:hypothetical protein